MAPQSQLCAFFHSRLFLTQSEVSKLSAPSFDMFILKRSHATYEQRILYAAKLMTSMGMHNDQKYGKSFMTSHENSDRDNGAKMLII